MNTRASTADLKEEQKKKRAGMSHALNAGT